jgi:hypothetical protein
MMPRRPLCGKRADFAPRLRPAPARGLDAFVMARQTDENLRNAGACGILMAVSQYRYGDFG